ncbi:uncharacterized protein ColSpa_11233 [Colletotrichum spaethianum]|uniref:Uncharacterized protein n=1 Tax=Colletotrichum spaethianum TaxID=700344 RepID=A0AA37PF36_9PEZI|nr:uncharacterized protein ColSpa_11233 [Colletotrichum spaethianum]GKT51052.1 hypothetical protein ColSpa_11233 [Colletotrichum spaethianum]
MFPVVAFSPGAAKRSRLLQAGDEQSTTPQVPRAQEMDMDPATRRRKVPSVRGWADLYDHMTTQDQAWVLLGECSDSAPVIQRFLSTRQTTIYALHQDVDNLSGLLQRNREQGLVLQKSLVIRILDAATELRWCSARLTLTLLADAQVVGKYERDPAHMMGILRKERKEKHLSRFLVRATQTLCACFIAVLDTYDAVDQCFVDSTLYSAIPFHSCALSIRAAVSLGTDGTQGPATKSTSQTLGEVYTLQSVTKVKCVSEKLCHAIAYIEDALSGM